MDSKGSVYIHVSNNRGTPWVETSAGKVKGYAFLDNRLLTADELADYCLHAFSQLDFRPYLYRLNGCFSILLDTPQAVYLIADKRKSYPLFYTASGAAYHVADTGAEALRLAPKKDFCPDAVLQFLSSGYLSGGNTLFTHIDMVAPGSVVKLCEGVALIEYYANDIKPRVQRTKEEVVTEAAKAFEHAFQRTLQVAAGRTLVLPLSGGYDSRMIACLCRKYNVEKVVCYTYGIEGSEEVEISRRTARQLGFDWYAVECTAEKWERLVRSDLFRNYILYGGNLNAIAHIQDFLALHELTERALIPADSIFVPGHTGDVSGGSHLPWRINAAHLANDILDKYFCLNLLTHKARRRVRKNLQQELSSICPLLNEDDCYEAFYRWGACARQANFIINSVRAYEYFGYSWLLPMWDDEFEEFWSSVPAKERVGSALYTEFAFCNYFEPMSVAFRKPEVSSMPTLKQRLIGSLLSKDNRYRIKHLLSEAGFYHFPKDNAALDEAARILNSLFTQQMPELALQKEEIMSVKARYYLYLLTLSQDNKPQV